MSDKKSDDKQKTLKALRLTKGINIPSQSSIPPMPPVKPPKSKG